MSEKNIKKQIAEIFEEVADVLETGKCGKKIRVGVTLLGSEHGPEEIAAGAIMAQETFEDIEVILIGNKVDTKLQLIEAKDEKEAHEKMDQMLMDGLIDAAVTMHYNFPIGVSTVGKIITPAMGKEMYLGTTTGTSETERITAMLKNTIYSIATAKACGNKNPSVGILNIDGARQVERALKKLEENGYKINFSESARKDGGIIMRGNDLLMGVPDIMVTDSLTGNVLVKVFSASTTGGNYESLGYGYGPGVGENYDKIICIISRASGAPVIKEAIRYAADCTKGNLLQIVKEEFAAAKKAGWDNILDSLKPEKDEIQKEIKIPSKKVVSEEIPGIEVMDLEDAVHTLWQENIYAESGMGCTGPIIMLAEEDKEKALGILKKKGYL